MLVEISCVQCMPLMPLYDCPNKHSKRVSLVVWEARQVAMALSVVAQLTRSPSQVSGKDHQPMDQPINLDHPLERSLSCRILNVLQQSCLVQCPRIGGQL